MRTVLILLTMLMPVSSFAQDTVLVDGDKYSLVLRGSDANALHTRTANAFAQQIGELLKQAYPSQVLEPRVELQTWMVGDRRQFELRYTCRIVSTDATHAQDRFDRRGTIQYGKTRQAAETAVEKELKGSQTVAKMRQEFEKVYGNSQMPENFVRSDWTGSAQEGYWSIKEFFAVARKQK